MARGDHIWVLLQYRGVPFQHHGIDIGDGSVVHLAPERGAPVAVRCSSADFQVRRDPIADFSRGMPVRVVHHDKRLPPNVTVQRALESLGKTGYDLIDHNCEHFATWCATGSWYSDQIERSRHVVCRGVSAMTKVAWLASRRTAARKLLKTPARIHPAFLVADGVEAAVSLLACTRQTPPDQADRLAKLAGAASAAVVGAVIAGPAGAAAGVALHTLSGEVAERSVEALHHVWRRSAMKSHRPLTPPDTVAKQTLS